MFNNIYKYRKPYYMPNERISFQNPNLSLSIFGKIPGGHFQPFTPISPFNPYEQYGFYKPFDYYGYYKPYEHYGPSGTSPYLNHFSYQNCMANCYNNYKDNEPMYLNCINQCMKTYGYR